MALTIEAMGGYADVEVRRAARSAARSGAFAASRKPRSDSLRCLGMYRAGAAAAHRACAPRLRLTRGRARAQGRTRTRFSAYAATALQQLAAGPPPWLPRDAPLGVLAADFARYAALPPPAREALVKDAAAVVARALDAWPSLSSSSSSPLPRPPPRNAAAAGGVRMVETGGQRNATWYQKRDALLTASTFGNILGFWGEDRLHQLWVRFLRSLA